MSFNYLLFRCLEAGITHCEEQGVGVGLSPRDDETVLIFSLDNLAARTQFKLTEKACCDKLLFYKRSVNHPILFFVELKESRIDNAFEQLENAYDAICPHGTPHRPYTLVVRHY